MEHMKKYITQDDVVWLCELYAANLPMREVVATLRHPRVHLLFPGLSGAGPFRMVMYDGGYNDIYRHLPYGLCGTPACVVSIERNVMDILGEACCADPGDVVFLNVSEVVVGWLRVQPGKVLVLFRRG